MRETGNENLILAHVLFMDCFPANRWMNLGLLNYRIGARKSPKQAKNEIIEGNCNLSACDSNIVDTKFLSTERNVEVNVQNW